MSKKIWLGSALLFFLLVCGCAILVGGFAARGLLGEFPPFRIDELKPVDPVTAKLGEEFSLKLGQAATLDDGLVVAFVSVPTDGRCSSCTASFYAAMQFEMATPGKSPNKILLKTPPLSGVEGDTLPYTFKFVRLQPQRNYPNDRLNAADYVVTLIITKTN